MNYVCVSYTLRKFIINIFNRCFHDKILTNNTHIDIQFTKQTFLIKANSPTKYNHIAYDLFFPVSFLEL